jgi:two-component system, NtrC family, sensor kinase
MNNLVKLSMILILPVFLSAQPQETQLESLQRSLKNASNDTIRMDVYLNLALYYNEIDRDSSLFYLTNGLSLAQKLNLKLYEAHFLENRGYMLTSIGNYPKALESFLASLKILEDIESEKYAWNLRNGQTPRLERLNKLGYLHLTMGHLYGRTNNNDNQISSYHQSLAIAETIQDSGLMALANWALGRVYLRLNKPDSALLFAQKALLSIEGKYRGGVLNSIGQIYEAKGEYELALDAYRKSLNYGLEQNNLTGIAGSALSLSSLFITFNKPDSSLYYSRKALEISEITKQSQFMANAYQLISDVYRYQGKWDSAYEYLKLAIAIRDSLNNVQRENLLTYQNLGFDEQLRLRELEEEKASFQNKIRTNTLMGSLFTLLIIAFFLYRNNKHKQKANTQLQEQKEEIQTTLEQLKSTQSQLIQSEKMASLGELTAGIAHEIQNPLNFVNNFSEVSNELIVEIEEERAKNQESRDEKLISEILADIQQNLEKINHHGKRADAIVKGMLQHSRSSTGQKEPTDINALADEYLRLSYHGLRAKDKTFNADFETDFDPDLPKIMVIPQDIGRVLLNLINNAFYACAERYGQSVAEASRSAANERNLSGFQNLTGLPDQETYKPTVTITTKNLGDRIEITVKDNGPGIPEEIKNKIFQPFFTTKPTGQGTGLGLSLSYDIVKAYGGELSVRTPSGKVETKEGEGTIFTMQLPLKYSEL